MDGLRRSYYGNVARNTLLYKELNRVLERAAGDGQPRYRPQRGRPGRDGLPPPRLTSDE